MLIDTNVFTRLLTAPELLGSKALHSLAVVEKLYASIISQYEMAIKQRIGKADNFELLVSEAAKQTIHFLPVTTEQYSI